MILSPNWPVCVPYCVANQLFPNATERDCIIHSLYPCPTPILHSSRGKITNSELVALFSAIFFLCITVCELKHSMLEGASVSVLLPCELTGRVLGRWLRMAQYVAKELPARTLAHQMPPSHEGSHPVDFKVRVQKQNTLPFAI